MKKPILASSFCQVAWVVRDLAAAERFFVDTVGISRFLHMDNLAAKDTEGTYLGKPADWVCNLHIAYAGDMQIELIQPVSGASMYPAIGVVTEIVGATKEGHELRRNLKLGIF